MNTNFFKNTIFSHSQNLKEMLFVNKSFNYFLFLKMDNRKSIQTIPQLIEKKQGEENKYFK